MVFKWSREEIERLIICVQQHSCIYNIKSTDYVDRNKKALAFNSILEELQEMQAGITLDEIKRKWKNLRTQYMQELRTFNQSKKSGSGMADVYVPKLWCFHQLNFLKSHAEMRTSHDNTGDKENTPSSYQDVDLTLSEDTLNEETLNMEPPKKRLKTLGAVNAFRKDLGNFKNIISQRKTEKKFAWLGNLVTNLMEQVRPEEQDDAAWQVQCLMRKLTSPPSSSTTSTSGTTHSSKDIIELSMEGIFDDDDTYIQF